jgi:hypothetical protein
MEKNWIKEEWEKHKASKGEGYKPLSESIDAIKDWDVEKTHKEIKEKKNNQRKRIELPDNRLISEFSQELALILKDKNYVFFRESSRDIIEIGDITDNDKNEEYIGFLDVKPDRFITLVEKFVIPLRVVHTKKGIYENEQSMNSTLAKTVICSQQMQSNLPKIKRIFTTPLPILLNGKLTFPKKGYDERFCSWLPLNAPEIEDNMPLEEAKEILKSIYEEFCFQERQDYINALAGLMTPFLRGLFPSFSTRTPVFFYIANRERAGKDYCAGITGILYEGHNLEEPPISTGEMKQNNNEELRKKILSAMIAGRKRLHFANNKGYIDNGVFEGVITSTMYSDRALGRNEILTFDNEIDFSLSGNVGIGFTPDLANRARFVRLFLEIEDANKRKFKNPNLHLWVKENRSKILSAMYSLVKHWIDSGKPEGSVAFSSFPEWARVCGGIMECCGYGSPCETDEQAISVGGDSETKDMKTLFEMGYQMLGEKWIKKQDIKDLVEENQEVIFSDYDFGRRSDQTRFGTILDKFVGRMLSGVYLKVKDNSVRSARKELMFTKIKPETDKKLIFDEKVGNLGNFGNLCNPSCESKFLYGEGVDSYQGSQGYQHSPFTKEDMSKAGYSEQEIKELVEES